MTGVRGTVPDEVTLARAFLSRVAEPACVPLWDAVRRHGPVDTVAAIRDGHPDPDVRAAVAARFADVEPESDLEAAARHGCRLVVPESDEWPHFAMAALEATGLRRVAEFRAGKRARDDTGERVPPLALWVRGRADLTTLGIRSVAVVGARAASAYGEHVTKVLAYGLAARDLAVVSGGAYGIDGCAHRAARAAEGVTALVSAAGLDRAYPPGHAKLFDDVASDGLVLSESPPGVAPHRHRFLSRNRLIATLSSGVVVTEAAARSGALNTAKHARELGRAVMAVPGPVTASTSAGCHNLLRRQQDETAQPASLVTGVDDVLQIIGVTSLFVSAPGRTSATPEVVPTTETLRTRLDSLSGAGRHVFDAFDRYRVSRVDEIVARSGSPLSEVMSALPVLELSGLVERCQGGYRIMSGLLDGLV